jgi:predicted dehydrogenase
MSPKVGLVGAGRWAEVHKRALEEVDATLAGVLVSSAGSRERVAKSWRVRATRRQDDFLAWDMDAVIVASPNYLHAEHSIAALEAGKYVLVEKPMATTLEDGLVELYR